MIRILQDAYFTSHQMQSGDQVGVQVNWQSDGSDTLYLHYDADQFSIVPDQVSLPKSAAGAQEFKFRITRKGANVHCDVNFQFFDDHRVDSVEVQ